ncbi:bifunctional UDP-N-acetylglucosamine diphosphorylase/glucosamine-1-phosphate N-acetyltransferase GlmU [Saccharibacillus sacchari]|uniref:Bifunctional UDP-N-acetylglucosamine diphosphorylase/glucosamine-1-phosphate N-acetyltransferase GlmU n=1 Tax=Saccharibacillus sacchari TaxID=456493 RepID=A0ACC6P835_9BACL
MKRMAIVLAAGKGKRMKSKLYKVLHPVCGKPMVGHVVNTVRLTNSERTVVIVGHGAEDVQAYLGDQAEYALQAEQLGTGHAVQQAEELLGKEEGTTILICGDTPLVRAETIEAMIALHEGEGAAATILTAVPEDPTGLGRIIRGEDGGVLRIVEQKDCTPEEAAVNEINTGTYCFDNRKLFDALSRVTNNNAQGEYYITDVIGILRGDGEKIAAYATRDLDESIGVNDRVVLSQAEAAMRERIVREHMLGGVTVIDPSSTYIGADVTIGSDTVLYPGTVITGQTTIGEDCKIGPNSEIENAVIGNGTAVSHSVVRDSKVGDHVSVGPFAHLRPGASLAEGVKVGNFVEVKNAEIGQDSKVSHLSYVGDAKVGSRVNIGCGAITVNYDGFNKSLTEIEDDAFVGSNVNLIAPVHVGQGAYVVAGSTITKQVPAGDLAIGRARQENKPGYADKIKARAKAKKEASKKQ